MLSFFKKLFSALNSAQSPYQLALALSFGLFSGFLPMFTPLNFLILFLIFTLNIPIGLYFASLAIFSIGGYFLDPLFCQLGEFVLKHQSLEGLWTFFYNNPILIWTNFNYTAVMGSFIVGFFTAIISFFVFKAFVPKIRVILEKISKMYGFLSWINPYSDKKLKKKPKLIRWWGSIGFVGVVSAIVFVFLVLLDPSLKFILEKSIGFVTQTDLEIKSLETKLKDLSINIKDISAYKDDERKISIDRVYFAADPMHALAKKLDITKMGFTNLNLDPKQTKQKTKKQTKKSSSFSLPSIDLPDVDSILKKEKISSKDKLENANKDAKEIQRKWNEIAQKDLNGDKIKEFKTRLNGLKKLKIKDPKTLKNALKKVKKISQDLKTYKKHIRNIVDDFKADKSTIESYVAMARQLPLREFNNLIKKYSNLTSGSLNFVSTYISPTLARYFKTAIQYYEKFKPYLQSDEDEEEEKKEEYKRIKGKWIYFKNTSAYPYYCVRQLKGNILSKDVSYDLVAKDLTPEQRVLNKPSVGILTTKSNVYKDFKATFTYDIRQKKSLINTKLALKGLKKKNLISAGDFRLKSAVLNLRTDFDIVDFKDLSGNFHMDFLRTKMILSKSDTKITKILADVFSKIKSFDIKGKMFGKVLIPEFSIKSNLDKKINKALRLVFEQEKQKFKKELKQKLEKMLQKEIEKLNLSNSDMDKISKVLQGEENLIKTMEKELKQKYSKKKLEQRLKKQEKKKLKSKTKKEKKKLKGKAKKEIERSFKF